MSSMWWWFKWRKIQCACLCCFDKTSHSFTNSIKSITYRLKTFLTFWRQKETLPVHLCMICSCFDRRELMFSVYNVKTYTLGYCRFDSSWQMLLYFSLCPSFLSHSPMLSSIKAWVSENILSLLLHKISSVYALHVNPSSLSFICRLWILCWRASFL